MSATTGLTHGPLAGQDLAKLTGLSVLLSAARLHKVLRVWPSGIALEYGEFTLAEFAAAGFTYLGERPELGSPAILAPEGGWKSNPVPGRIVRDRGLGFDCASEKLDWRYISAFSLIEDAKPLTPISEIAEAVKGLSKPETLGETAASWGSVETTDARAQALSDLAEMDGGLKPCPFCGCAPAVSEYEVNDDGDTKFAVGCDCRNAPECQAFAERYVNVHGHTRDEAVSAWNTRATPASPPAETGEGVSALETRAFLGANEAQSVEFYQALVRDLWKAACDGSELTESAVSAILAKSSDPSATERMRAGVVAADDAPVWAEGIVTDGERVAFAQKAEADYGGTYWATDEGDGALEWEPTHFIARAALGEA